ncbi:MAG: type II toxin-antitoxin system VapC family toxin [Salinivenus sp.]
MKTTVLDSYALLAYFEKEAGRDTVAQLLADAAADEHALYGCVVNWGEVLYITERVYGAEKAEDVEAVMADLPIEWVAADRALTRVAAQFKVEGGLAYADCFAAGLAKRIDGDLLTGDPEFETLADDVPVRWLA